jgi:hypothetical protein
MTPSEIIAKVCEADDETLAKMSMNAIANMYRDGADLRTLIPLLRHSRSQTVECGAWIASEVVDRHKGREILHELSELLDHPTPAVRFWVIESVALLVKPDDRSIIPRLFILASDPNPGVRRQALYWLCWIPDSIVESLRDTPLWSSSRLLLPNTTKEEIRGAIRSVKMFDQRMGIASVCRNFGTDQGFLQEIIPYLDNEVKETLSRLPRNRAFSR